MCAICEQHDTSVNTSCATEFVFDPQPVRHEKRPVVPLLALLESTAFKLSSQEGKHKRGRYLHRCPHNASPPPDGARMDIITVNEAQRHLVALRRNAYWHASSRRLIDSTSATSSRQDERSKGGTSLGRGLRLAK